MKPVNFIAVIALVLNLLPAPHAFACTVCHSKNPKMVRMHEALLFKDCFTCHGPSAKKIDSSSKNQMTTDERCVRCHKQGSTRDRHLLP